MHMLQVMFGGQLLLAGFAEVVAALVARQLAEA
jgi:hypothetical protein